MKKCALLASAIGCLLVDAHACTPSVGLAECDSDGDRSLVRGEVSACLIRFDPTVAKLKAESVSQSEFDDFVDEITVDLMYRRDAIRVEDVEDYLVGKCITERRSEKFEIGWKGLEISRKLTDTDDPRSKKFTRPFILSYADNREKNDHSFTVLGDIAWYKWGDDRELVPSSDVNSSWTFKPTTSLDTSTNEAASDSNVTIGLELSSLWTNNSAGTWVTDQLLTLTAKYNTDRDFRRDVTELSLGYSVATVSPFKMGRYIRFGGQSGSIADDFQLSLSPSVALEVGNVSDPGGNEDLEALSGDDPYSRLAPSVKVVLQTPFAKQRVSAGFSYTHRFDLSESWDRGFGTFDIKYNFTEALAFTIIYRKGSKPLNFSRVDEVLIGIGFQR